jgi:hypothetical protein
MRITILEPAQSDLEDGYMFYEAKSPGLGIYFLNALYSDIDSLKFYAGIHPVSHGYHRMLSRRFPFAVYYDFFDERVVVNAVLDCRRSPSWLRRRLGE